MGLKDKRIKIGIAEDKDDLRKNLEQILALLGDFELIFSVADGALVLDAIAKYGVPDLILMDIEMPLQDGIVTTRDVKAKYPSVRVLILTIFDQKDSIFRALQNGADGYLLKGERPKEVLKAIEQVLDGKMPMSADIAQKVLLYFRNFSKDSKPKTSDFDLTKRETEILELLSDGMAYKEIAASLNIATRTVNTHVESIYKKLNVHSAIEASNIARKNDWF